MKKKRIILGILALTVILTTVTGCRENTDNEDLSGEGVISGEMNQEDQKTYNNGGSFVSYKGKTYYREYNNECFEEEALHGDFTYKTDTKILKYMNVISKNGKIENVFQDDSYGRFYIANDRFFLQGYQDRLYSVDMKGENRREIAEGYYVRYDEENQELYYINTKNNNAMYKIDTQDLKITKIAEDEVTEIPDAGEISIDSEVIGSKNGDYVYVDGTYYTAKVVLSEEEVEMLKQKYIQDEADGEYIIKISDSEKVNDKVYFKINVAKHKPEEDIDSSYAYERIASEVYSYDLNTGKKALIYMYKSTDDDSISGDNLSGDLVEELGENEMYLEIRLQDKGLKDTFEVRVEEVGGLIIGKRIEYEGTHSRSEGMLKIKVTREVGAMLSVYIDDKLDTQMLIEAE